MTPEGLTSIEMNYFNKDLIAKANDQQIKAMKDKLTKEIKHRKKRKGKEPDNSNFDAVTLKRVREHEKLVDPHEELMNTTKMFKKRKRWYKMVELRKEYISEKKMVSMLNKESLSRYKINKQLLRNKDLKYIAFGSTNLLKIQSDVLYKVNRPSSLYKTKKGKPFLAIYW